jgi:hypothetical protein
MINNVYRAKPFKVTPEESSVGLGSGISEGESGSEHTGVLPLYASSTAFNGFLARTLETFSKFGVVVFTPPTQI